MTGVPQRLGAALADRYRIERELGQGGMATVYLAQDLKHDRRVAVKVLRPELAAVIGAERFLAEIKVTANLQHPNLLPLFDSGEAGGFLYYVMPYLEGETLRARLARERQLPGTPHYMSPEQAAGDRELDARSDQYALAAVTYEMLSGEPPHTGPTAQVIIARLMSEKPRGLRETRPGVPVALDLAVRRALAKSPADRFSSCGAFAGALVAGPAPRRRGRTIAISVAGLAVVAVAAWLAVSRRGNARPTGQSNARSIAVLPLVNVGGDSTQEYFADGMTEELANALGKVRGLRVAARTSSYSFKGRRDLDVREVGDKLGVGVVLEGSVRRAGDRVKVSVQLIDARERVELWSESYDKAVKDIFAVQDSITQAIVGQLALKLGGAELAGTLAGRTTNPEAHDLYLQGQALLHQSTEPALRRALDYYRQALAIDPSYAQAWNGVAWAYAWLADAYQMPAIAFDSAKTAARRALDRDSLSGEAYSVLGWASYAIDWNVAAAERELRRAVELSPNSADVHAMYGLWLCFTGRTDAGLAEADRALELDHLAAQGSSQREWCLYLARRYDEAIVQHAKTIAVDPTYIYLDWFVGAAYREQGRYEEALAEYRRAQDLMGDHPLYGYAITYARMGKPKEAREMLGRLEAYARVHYVNPFFFAAIHASLGERDRAFEWLERAASDRTIMMAGLKIWPELDPLRSDPRFAALTKRIGLAGAR